MNDFTKGEWVVTANGLNITSHCHSMLFIGVEFTGTPEDKANTKLVATAGNTANALAEQGIDAIKAIEMLPELIAKIEANNFSAPLVVLVQLDDMVKKLKGEQE